MKNTDLLNIIENELKKIACDRNPQELYEPIRYILSLGGKRLRPQLTLLSCSLFSNDIETAIPAALALEVFHNFTLIHDDIMDNATLRRGKPTVHTIWNNNVAILSGDAMSILAYHLLAKLPPEKLYAILPIFNDTALKVCEGQQYDMDFEKTRHVTESQYLQMITLKTASLIAACMQIGAIAGGAPDYDAQLLYNFGLNLGLAFQLQDDLLDTFGDEKTLGKEIGKDIAANKKTYLLIKALELANMQQREELEYWMGINPMPANEKITRVKHIFTVLGIEKITHQIISSYLNQAIKNLEEVNAPSIAKQGLFELIEKLNQRSF
jgi:geranylgeranyl diphosphate synthase type II